MKYSNFVKEELNRIGAFRVIDLIGKLKGEKVLIYCHDDPDGLTAGVIFKRLLKKEGVDCDVNIPRVMELSKKELERDVRDEDYSAVFVLDKATMGYYNEYSSITPNFTVIDHHPLIGENPENILVVNPQLHGEYKGCSTSFLVHMIATAMEKTDRYDDYLNLVGLKGDWMVEPATDYVSDYVEPFYETRVVDEFNNLVDKIESRPTMFEVEQREKTTLLNQITELYFALGGGGFQYFYNKRDKKLKDIKQPEFTFRLLERGSKNFDPDNWTSVDDYIKSTGREEVINLIFKYFKEDWKKTAKAFSGSTHVCRLGETEIYLFKGKDVTLMPMVGSVYLNNLKQQSGSDKVFFIMVDHQSSGRIHFSMRSTTDKVHAGKICSNLSDRLVEKFGHRDQISGGGHPFAAECKTGNSKVGLDEAMDVLNNLIQDMIESVDNEDIDVGRELGLEFLTAK
ncbi:MAG: DHH family phosphoesterase [Elusimicrobiota bacterium]